MITIGNLKDGMPDWSDKSNVYVGRKFAGLEASPLQNPFTIGRDGDRAGVVKKYRKYLKDKLAESHVNEIQFEVWDLWASVEHGDPITLWCWCSPERCHAEVIKEVVEHG